MVEYPDPVPKAVTGLRRPASLTDQIRMWVRHEVSQAAAQTDQGTFEEEDDFTLDETDIVSEYELMDDEYPIGIWPQLPDPAPAEPSSDSVDEPHTGQPTEPPPAG